MTGALCACMLLAGTLVATVGMPLTARSRTPPVPALPPPPTDQTSASPQTPVPAREAPGAIYQDAMHPLAVVRASIDNWSAAERAAFAVGMQRAREACDAAKPDDYRGEDLYDLARLCSFGQDWSPANDAAQKYMASKAQAHETQAMAISVRALAHIGSIDLAVITTYGLLHFPYDADVAHTVRFMKDTLEHEGGPVALTVPGEEHAAVVNALSQPGPLTAAGSDAAISTGALYASAMDLAFLNRFAGNTDAAAAAAADADAALQKLTAIPAEDQQEIDEVRRTSTICWGCTCRMCIRHERCNRRAPNPGSIPISAKPRCSCSSPTGASSAANW